MENNCIIKDIINKIIDNITDHYDFIDFVNTNSNGSKQAQWIKTYYKNQNTVSLLANIIRIVEVQNELTPIKQTFFHIQVHKQFVPNLCGYHATFNLIQGVQSIKYQISPQFENIAAFWSYVKRTQDFLREYRRKYIQDNSEWPWRDQDIESGDFERTYLKCCLQSKPLFKSTFQTETINGIKYYVNNDTIFYQYGNIVNGYNERLVLQKKFDQFITFNGNDKEQIIQAYMLGVTNHWISFLALKNKNGTTFIVMDSRNRDFFLWNENEIKQFLQNEQIERPKRGQQPLNAFYLDLYLQGMKDLQSIIKLLISWLSGQSKIESYVSNQKMLVFIHPLIELLEINQELFLNLKFTYDQAANLYQILALWAEQYKITVSEYIGNATQITQVNKLLFYKTIELTENALDYQNKNGIWKLQKQSPLAIIFKCLKLIKQVL